jgi:hypothetical protein
MKKKAKEAEAANKPPVLTTDYQFKNVPLSMRRRKRLQTLIDDIQRVDNMRSVCRKMLQTAREEISAIGKGGAESDKDIENRVAKNMDSVVPLIEWMESKSQDISERVEETKAALLIKKNVGSS